MPNFHTDALLLLDDARIFRVSGHIYHGYFCLDSLIIVTPSGEYTIDFETHDTDHIAAIVREKGRVDA